MGCRRKTIQTTILSPNQHCPEMEIYEAFCLDVAQGHMKVAPNETLELC